MTLEAIEAISRVKYTYFRLLDTKQFDKLGALFIEEATANYQSAPRPYTGRSEIVEFLSTSMADPGMVTLHQGHHPEIEVYDDGTATATWYLNDKVFIPRYDFSLEGSALYEDQYVLVGDEWKIRHTGYTRIFEERRKHSSGELISFTSRFESNSPS
jgi:hypothetical protein